MVDLAEATVGDGGSAWAAAAPLAVDVLSVEVLVNFERQRGSGEGH